MIRKANLNDIPRILQIYDAARGIMHQNGNYSQWGGAYPGEKDALTDIQNGTLYVMEDEAGAAEATYAAFTLIHDPEPTYDIIRNGQWLDTAPYGTIHRIASDGTHQSVFHDLIAFCKEKWDHLRIDTHEDNTIMRHVIPNEGFIYCGIITLRDGTDRLAYEWLKNT